MDKYFLKISIDNKDKINIDLFPYLINISSLSILKINKKTKSKKNK
jgi:hypothetical protein